MMSSPAVVPRLAGLGLLETELRALVRAGETVQQLDDVTGVRVRVVERAGEQRTGNRPRLDMHPLGEPCELLGRLVVKRDVQSLHGPGVHEP
jgi:hypothetical protein